MSFPNIPDINPHITLKRDEVINLLLSSIAMEELGLSHLLTAEAEKIQQLIKKKLSVEEVIATQESVEKILRNIIKTQILLQFKLEDVLKIPTIDCGCEDCDCEDCGCEDCDCEDCDCDCEDCDCEDCDCEDEIILKKKYVHHRKNDGIRKKNQNINRREKKRRK
ncbi:hypothetical protein [Bacillus thuringiensis]|uniref:hypothetical protein n=1 Tax=Bacillus thuringiensis TaxID=1428 RepID=UPI001FACEBB3|nr:hypothetical protein [Bacillus thuringiensis]MDM8365474.1 hypothetical protein [Bacillus thuringiensis]